MSKRGDRRQEKLSRRFADRQTGKNHLLPRVRGRAMRAIKLSATGRVKAVPPKDEAPTPPPPTSPPLSSTPLPGGGTLTVSVYPPNVAPPTWWSSSSVGPPAETFYTRWGRVSTYKNPDGTGGRTQRVHSWERMSVDELEVLAGSTFEPEEIKDVVTRLGDLGAGRL